MLAEDEKMKAQDATAIAMELVEKAKSSVANAMDLGEQLKEQLQVSKNEKAEAVASKDKAVKEMEAAIEAKSIAQTAAIA